MARIKELSGVKDVIRNLRLRRQTMGASVERGIKLAALLLQRESQQKVPVNFGVLKNSAFTRITGSGFGTEAVVGYTASYALYVHEAVGMVLKGQPRAGGRGRYWDPQGRAQAKFLEEPARTLGPEMRRIIQEAAKI